MVGNKPNFNDLDVVRALLYLEGREGRQELCARLDLGEGTVRTILGILKKKGLIRSTNKGHVFTEKGIALRKNIFERIIPPVEVKLHIYREYKRVAVLYSSGRRLKTDYTLRDTAVKNGAEGAIILRYEMGKGLVMDHDAGYSFEYLEDKFKFNENDLLIITFANALRDAENSALAVAERIEGRSFV
ncbi:hypothetical protein COV19_01665 [Candidatus Woesearchaeota archaeon CG10_big_fil_rev_8_21_14_0_10_44_13]|nr:MAG: hypothetical protein COV19_01665 [Candidatus Woesearchaeota archaeon CG10_big_fil_rev_8_21_14_0_10_44_13]